MSAVIKRGLLAGAAGTTLLNATTYLDMAIRGRSPSDTPERTVDAGLERAGQELPGDSTQRDNRRTALGALSGIASGLAIGVGASAVRALGVRLPGPLAAIATGAGAMAATDLPMAALGISDPRTWTAKDWVSDAVPHLAYGIGTHAVIAATDDTEPPPKAPLGLVVRSFGLGIATGMRSTLGATAPGLFGRVSVSTPGKLARLAAVGGELVADKLPNTPSRLEGPGLAFRVAAGVDGGFLLAHHADVSPNACILAASLGAVAGSYGGLAWRRWSGAQRADWHAAVLEDLAAVALAYGACRGV
jgi:uncharacterized membrane protein